MLDFLVTTIVMKTRSQSRRWPAPRQPTVTITTPEKEHRVRNGVVRTPQRRNVRTLYQQYRGKVPVLDIFKKAGVTKSTGYRILALNEDRSDGLLSQRGRKDVLTQEEAETVVEVEDSSFLMGIARHKQVCNYLGIAVEASESAIVQNIKKKTQTFLYSAADMKMLSRKNKDERIQFCRRGLYAGRIFKDILTLKFSDEVGFGRGSNKQRRVHRKKGQEQRYRPVKMQYKHKRKVQDFKFFATLNWYEGLSDLYLIKGSGEKGNMVKKDYAILLENFIAPEWRPDQILLEDNAVEHGTRDWDDELLLLTKSRIGIRCRSNPANSPDLNPIEKCWRVVKQRLKMNYGPFKNGRELWEAIQSEWRVLQENDADLVRSYILDLPRRYVEVIRRDGDPISD